MTSRSPSPPGSEGVLVPLPSSLHLAVLFVSRLSLMRDPPANPRGSDGGEAVGETGKGFMLTDFASFFQGSVGPGLSCLGAQPKLLSPLPALGASPPRTPWAPLSLGVTCHRRPFPCLPSLWTVASTLGKDRPRLTRAPGASGGPAAWHILGTDLMLPEEMKTTRRKPGSCLKPAGRVPRL